MTDFQTQSISVTQAIAPINYNLDDQRWTVLAGVTVRATNDAAVICDTNLGRLINNGALIGQGNNFNSAGVSIAGGFSNPADMIINNNGTITGTQRYGVYVGQSTDGFVLNNDGTVTGFFAGVTIQSENVGGTVNNSGLIRSNNVAIFSSTDFGIRTTINNDAGATIRALGTEPAIQTSFGNIRLTNDGNIFGKIDLSATNAENDLVINTGKITGIVELGLGNDTFRGTGGTAARIFGEAGADRIIGGAGNEQIHGGGVGSGGLFDTLTGGGGRDLFYFEFTISPFINLTKITDFTPNLDEMMLDRTFFGAATGPNGTLQAGRFWIGAAAHDANDRIIYNKGNGIVYFDPDGKNGFAQQEFARLSKNLALDNGDFTVIA